MTPADSKRPHLNLVPPVGPLQAAMIIAAIGSIGNARERGQAEIVLWMGPDQRADRYHL
jgi:hypothetical protein